MCFSQVMACTFPSALLDDDVVCVSSVQRLLWCALVADTCFMAFPLENMGHFYVLCNVPCLDCRTLGDVLLCRMFGLSHHKINQMHKSWIAEKTCRLLRNVETGDDDLTRGKYWFTAQMKLSLFPIWPAQLFGCQTILLSLKLSGCTWSLVY